MTDIRTATICAIHDALALRGPSGDGTGFMRAAAPGDYMTPERLRLAREVARHLPATATRDSASQFVDSIAPIVIRSGRVAAMTPQRPQIIT